MAKISNGKPPGPDKESGKGPGSNDSLSSINISELLFNFIPHNPSIGLRLFTPIVPAADNRPALFLVTTTQLLLGLLLMTRRTPRFGESVFRARLSTVARYLGGSAAVFLSGLEYSRLALPYDPWAEEAKRWRKWAVKTGQKPSWWFGGIWHYQPMNMSEWQKKTRQWILNTSQYLRSTEEPVSEVSNDNNMLTGISIGPLATLRQGESQTYEDIYQNLHRINSRKMETALKEDLMNVTELNKAERIDLILEGKGPVHLNEEYGKPNITLGNHDIKDEDDFEMMWANFEPWDELGQETDFDVRLIPRS